MVQVNAFEPSFRSAAIEMLLGVADQCDGVRCDMAMLLLNDIFARTWGERAGEMPATEYWQRRDPRGQAAASRFPLHRRGLLGPGVGVATAGFDYCYDKRLYDRMEHDDVEGVRLHLNADLAYQHKLLRFIENHDEPRAAVAFAAAKARAAAITMATIPGAKLFHEGQFEARRTRVPVFLSRRPEEPLDEACQAFYRKLLTAINTPVFRDGQWTPCNCSGWPDNTSFQKLGVWSWAKDDDRDA